jgi:hypothetical protein
MQKKEQQMSGISRRRFLRDTSLGAAGLGAVAIVGTPALGLVTATSAAATPLSLHPASPDRGVAAPRAPGAEVMAHIVGDASGTICLYSGTTKVTFEDRSLTDALLKAAW